MSLLPSIADELAQHIAGKGPDEFVFTAPRGGVLRNHNFRRNIFDPAAREIGLPELTPHDLRHTAASLAKIGGVAADASFDKISERLLPATSSFGADHGLGFMSGSSPS